MIGSLENTISLRGELKDVMLVGELGEGFTMPPVEVLDFEVISTGNQKADLGLGVFVNTSPAYLDWGLGSSWVKLNYPTNPANGDVGNTHQNTFASGTYSCRLIASQNLRGFAVQDSIPQINFTGAMPTNLEIFGLLGDKVKWDYPVPFTQNDALQVFSSDLLFFSYLPDINGAWSSLQVDRCIKDLKTAALKGATIDISGNNAARTSASDADILALRVNNDISVNE